MGGTDGNGSATRCSVRAGFAISVAWSPDSSRLVTGGSDGTAKVWEIGTEGVRELWSLSAQETGSWHRGRGLLAGRDPGDGRGRGHLRREDLGPGTGRRCRVGEPSRRRRIPRRSSCPTDGAWWRRPGRRRGRLTIWDLGAGRDLRTLGPATDSFLVPILRREPGRQLDRARRRGARSCPRFGGAAAAQGVGYVDGRGALPDRARARRQRRLPSARMGSSSSPPAGAERRRSSIGPAT